MILIMWLLYAGSAFGLFPYIQFFVNQINKRKNNFDINLTDIRNAKKCATIKLQHIYFLNDKNT